MNTFFEISKKLIDLSEQCELEAVNYFKIIEQNAYYNESKVLRAFLDNKVSSCHFVETTGYGYNDPGRTVIDNVFKQVFKSESSLTRCTFVCGTHAISVALFSILKPGDIVLSVTGTPYDTVQKVFGIAPVNNKSNSNLKKYGVNFQQINLLKNGSFDFNQIKLNLINKIKLIYIQRSKGYSTRPSVSIDQIEKLVKFIKQESPNTLILVDNCYGEFVEKKEPTEVGVNLMCGSLIKNPGGAIAQTGGYIAGDLNLIEKCAETFTAPGLGLDIGCNFNQNRNILMGLFVAPRVVANSLKLSCFSRLIFKKLGFEVFPKTTEQPKDIVSAIQLKSETALQCFCEGIQNNSPIDSFLTPTPWQMPGYYNEIIMAAGTFTSGSSIEISADAPKKPPYNVFLQGGITYNTGKICILNTIQQMVDRKILDIKKP